MKQELYACLTLMAMIRLFANHGEDHVNGGGGGAAERRQAADADAFQARTCGGGGHHREPATAAGIRPPGNRGSYGRRDRPVSATAPSGPVL